MNFYFAFTKPQLSFILRHRSVHSEVLAYLIYIGKANAVEKFDLTDFSGCLAVDASTGRLNRNNALAKKSIIERILSLKAETNNLIFPGLLHPLMNSIYARFRCMSAYSVYIYAEGISSYLDLKLPLIWQIRFIILRWLAVLNGFSYGVKIKGHPHGLDMQDVKGLIAEYPKLLTRHGKSVELLVRPMPSQIEFIPLVKEVMFIGQPHLDSRIDLAVLFLDLADGLKKHFQFPLVYKPHHFEPIAQLEAAQTAGFKIIRTDLPFEDLIQTRRPAVVVSYRSTALINASLILGKSTKVFTFAPFIVSPPDECGSLIQLREIMTMFGVDSFPVDSCLGKIEISLGRKIGANK